jgi:hypothetical protein
MKLTLIGCEYVGKTTLAGGIAEWTNSTAGEGRGFHDHFAIPNEELSRESKEHPMTAPPQLKEMFQRFMIAHHLSRDFLSDRTRTSLVSTLKRPFTHPFTMAMAAKIVGRISEAARVSERRWHVRWNEN